MALTLSRAVDILTPDGNSLALFIDASDNLLKLKDVNGNIELFSTYINGGIGSPGGLNKNIQFNDSGYFGGDSLFVYDKLNNRVGIGIDTPVNPLDVVKNQASSTRLNIQNTDSSGTASLRFTTVNGLSGIYINSANQLTLQNAITSASIRIQTTNSLGNTSNAIFIDGEQNVGFGNITPSFQIDTTNDVRFNGIRIGHGGGNISKNTIVGENSLILNSAGDENTAMGYFALSSIVGGNYNTAVGSQSLLSCTASQNTAIGYRALSQNVGGNFNTALGSSSLYNNLSGQNTSVGHESAFSNVSGDGITAIGFHALRASLGNYNTALGWSAGNSITTGNGNICIGYNAQPTSATSSNEFVVGSTTANAGAVSSSTLPATGSSIFLWRVRVNGTNYSVVMLP